MLHVAAGETLLWRLLFLTW